VVLLGDNASWHLSHETFLGLEANKTYLLRNIPYNPQLNSAVEATHALIKNKLKRIKMGDATNNTKQTFKD
jgi:hypothetical protein